MLNLGMVLILAAAAASPSPAPSAQPADPCGTVHTNLLAALNRPSIGYSACAVKVHEAVAEIGYAENTSGQTHAATYPQGFLRYGAAQNFEVDLIGPAYGVALPLGGPRTAGAFDYGLGVKYEWWHDAKSVLASDFLYTVPTGSAEFTAGSATQTLNADYGTVVAGNLSFATTLGLASAYASALDGRSARFFSALPSAVLSYQWNPRAQAFIEEYAQTRIRPDGGSLLGTDLALQYLVTPGFEVDAEIGQTVTDLTRAHYAGFGFGARF